MNAPANTAALAKPTLQLLALNALVPSKSHVQELRRARFKKEALQKLAEDIRRNGLMQPPLVRPMAGGKHEIVYGERRFLGAKLAGLLEIYVSVRELSDEQALEAQLSENLEREDLHELEEAEGYEELMKLKKLKARAARRLLRRRQEPQHHLRPPQAACPLPRGARGFLRRGARRLARAAHRPHRASRHAAPGAEGHHPRREEPRARKSR